MSKLYDGSSYGNGYGYGGADGSGEAQGNVDTWLHKLGLLTE